MKERVSAIWFILNTVCFFLYGYDKKQARNSGRRISENVLLLFSVLGILGAVLGRRIFHHKTRKTKFRILIPLILILETVLAVWLYSRYG